MGSSEFNFEMQRKLVHVALTCYPLFLIYFNVGTSLRLLISLIYFTAWIFSEFLRIYLKIKTPTGILISKISRHVQIGDLDKHRYKIRFPYWILGLSIIMLVSSNTALLVATVTLTFGDSISGIAKSLLKDRNIFVGIFSGTLISLSILYLLTQNLLISLLCPFLGMLSELIGNRIDDNFSIPLFSGLSAILVQLI